MLEDEGDYNGWERKLRTSKGDDGYWIKKKEEVKTKEEMPTRNTFGGGFSEASEKGKERDMLLSRFFYELLSRTGHTGYLRHNLSATPRTKLLVEFNCCVVSRIQPTRRGYEKSVAKDFIK